MLQSVRFVKTRRIITLRDSSKTANAFINYVGYKRHEKKWHMKATTEKPVKAVQASKS